MSRGCCRLRMQITWLMARHFYASRGDCQPPLPLPARLGYARGPKKSPGTLHDQGCVEQVAPSPRALFPAHIWEGTSMSMSHRLGAEFFGTFWLVLGGCGSAVLAAAFPDVGIGLTGVSLAFGLTVVTMAYAVGHISGGHFNPAVTLGLWAGGRFPAGRSSTTGRRRSRAASPRRRCSTSSPPARRTSRCRAASPPTATPSIRPAATRWSPRWCARW